MGGVEECWSCERAKSSGSGMKMKMGGSWWWLLEIELVFFFDVCGQVQALQA